MENGYFEVAPETGDLLTREKFGDCQLHVEWSEPPDIRGTSQGRGNSGVLLMSRYEIQVLDAVNNPTYADGQAGAIYGQWPPLVNPARKPGEWNVYDIVFEAPQFDGGKLVKPAYFTVFFNGVMVHNRKESHGAHGVPPGGPLHAAAGRGSADAPGPPQPRALPQHLDPAHRRVRPAGKVGCPSADDRAGRRFAQR